MKAISTVMGVVLCLSTPIVCKAFEASEGVETGDGEGTWSLPTSNSPRASFGLILVPEGSIESGPVTEEGWQCAVPCDEYADAINGAVNNHNLLKIELEDAAEDREFLEAKVIALESKEKEKDALVLSLRQQIKTLGIAIDVRDEQLKEVVQQKTNELESCDAKLVTKTKAYDSTQELLEDHLLRLNKIQSDLEETHRARVDLRSDVQQLRRENLDMKRKTRTVLYFTRMAFQATFGYCLAPVSALLLVAITYVAIVCLVRYCTRKARNMTGNACGCITYTARRMVALVQGDGLQVVAVEWTNPVFVAVMVLSLVPTIFTLGLDVPDMPVLSPVFEMVEVAVEGADCQWVLTAIKVMVLFASAVGVYFVFGMLGITEMGAMAADGVLWKTVSLLPLFILCMSTSNPWTSYFRLLKTPDGDRAEDGPTRPSPFAPPAADFFLGPQPRVRSYHNSCRQRLSLVRPEVCFAFSVALLSVLTFTVFIFRTVIDGFVDSASESAVKGVAVY